MSTITDWIISNLFTILVVGFIASWLIGRARRQKQRERTQQENDANRQNAEKLGMEVKQQAEGTRMMAGATNGPQVSGDTTYTGTTGDIPWTIDIKVRISDRGTGTSGDHVWKQTTRWKTTSVNWPAGKFLLIMSTPGEMKVGDVKEGGFFNKLVNWAADRFLDLYVGGYFGSEYTSLVNVTGATIVRKEGMTDFYMITNEPARAEKFLDESTQKTIANWKHASQGFQQERQVDQFGLLFAPDGLTVACQAGLTNPAEAKMFSDFAAVLAVKAKSVL